MVVSAMYGRESGGNSDAYNVTVSKVAWDNSGVNWIFEEEVWWWAPGLGAPGFPADPSHPWLHGGGHGPRLLPRLLPKTVGEPQVKLEHRMSTL